VCVQAGWRGGSSYKEGWLWWDDISMHSDNTSLAGPSKLEVKNIWNARAVTCPRLLRLEFISAVLKRKPDGSNGAWNSWKPHYVLWDGSKKWNTGYEERKQTDATQLFIELMIRSTCFGHYYAHHQEPEIIQTITAYST